MKKSSEPSKQKEGLRSDSKDKSVIVPATWDPMASDYYNKSFNSYVYGPGKSLSERADGRKMNEHVRLHFNNIPDGMDKDGLIAVCEKSRPNVLNGGIYKNKKTGTLWGLVEYASHREAQEVLLALHQTPPLNLRVSFGKSMETRVNDHSIRVHEAIRRQRKEREEIAKGVENSSVEFKPVENLFPKNDIDQETRLGLLDFAEDCFFNWKYQTARGAILPPRQPHLSWSLAPIKANIEHTRAKMCLDVNGNRDQELDYFHHFSTGFFEETTTIMETVYEKYRSKTGVGYKNIFGGRAFNLDLDLTPGQLHSPKTLDYFDMLTLDSVTVGEDFLTKMKFSGSSAISKEGRIAECTVCKEATSTCCSTCLLPFCSSNCIRELGSENCDHQTANLTSADLYPLFSKKNVKINNSRHFISNQDQNLSIVLDTPSVNVNVLSSILSEYSSKVTGADLVVQDIITQFGEPLGFTCIVCNSSVRALFRTLKNLHSRKYDESTADLIEVSPNLGVGELNCAPFAGKLCRVLLKEKLRGNGWSCIFVDKGEVCEIAEKQISALSPAYNSLPRFSLFASVTLYKTSFLDLWTKFIQPKKKLRLEKLEIVNGDGGTQLSAQLQDGKGTELCSLLISDWLPVRPDVPHDISSSISLKDKERVVVSTFCSSNMCYVQKVDRYEELCSLQIEVNLVGLNRLCLNELPKTGSIVAVKSAVDSKLYRAMVKTQTSYNTALVFYLDFGNREEVRVNQMYPLSTEIAKMPAEAVLLKLADVPEKPLNITAYINWAQLVEKRQVLEVSFDNSKKLATLISTTTNSSVNCSLRDALLEEDISGSVAKSLSASELVEKYHTSENAFSSQSLPLSEGKMLDLVMLHVFEDFSFTCTLAYSPLLRHVLDTQVREAAKYVAECKDGSYVPCAEEVCFAKFTDGLWYRALNVSSGKEWHKIMFIDLGILGRATITNLRKMPASFNALPRMATVATLAGLQESDYADHPQLAKYLQDMLKPFERFEGLVFEQDEEGKAKIYIPKVISQLRLMGIVSEQTFADLEKKLPPAFSTKTTSGDVFCANLIDISSDGENSTNGQIICAKANRVSLFDDDFSGLNLPLAPLL